MKWYFTIVVKILEKTNSVRRFSEVLRSQNCDRRFLFDTIVSVIPADFPQHSQSIGDLKKKRHTFICEFSIIYS